MSLLKKIEIMGYILALLLFLIPSKNSWNRRYFAVEFPSDSPSACVGLKTIQKENVKNSRVMRKIKTAITSDMILLALLSFQVCISEKLARKITWKASVISLMYIINPKNKSMKLITLFQEEVCQN